MSIRTLLTLPAEIRIQIYSYLLPTPRFNANSIYQLRLVCHQFKSEFEHEVSKMIDDYNSWCKTALDLNRPRMAGRTAFKWSCLLRVN